MRRVFNLSASQAQVASVSIAFEDAAVNVVGINSAMGAAVKGSRGRIELTYEGGVNANGALSLPSWTLTSRWSALELLVASDKIAPDPLGAGTSGGGSSSWSVIGIYGAVVYTIGAFLRMVYKDASKRIIYEELPDTDLLMDLCNGIYIARIQGDLEIEYKLFYQLVHIYRSPELLLDVSQSQDNHAIADLELTGLPEHQAQGLEQSRRRRGSRSL